MHAPAVYRQARSGTILFGLPIHFTRKEPSGVQLRSTSQYEPAARSGVAALIFSRQ
jgi:hypothetical protein